MSRPRAALEESDIPLIRQLLDSGMTQAEIADKFDVTRFTIGNIKKGKTWKHVGAAELRADVPLDRVFQDGSVQPLLPWSAP